MCTRCQPAPPSSTAQALAMLDAALGYLSGCDAASLGTAAQAEVLIGLEQAEARHTAARAKILTAFSANHGFQADGHFGAKPWLRALTKVTRGAAAGATGGAAAGRAPGGGRRAGGRAYLGVVGAADLRLDRPAA